MRNILIINLVTLSMITACTHLTPQPEHTVNPIPTPVLTKHHTNDNTKLTLPVPNGVKPEFVKTLREHIDGRWLLVSFDAFKFKPNETTMTFFKDGQGSVNAGCNTINFSYEFKNNLLTINNLSSTRMACDNPFESELVQFLHKPLTVKAEPTSFGTLINLKNAESKQLAFLQSPDNLPNQ